MLYGEENHGYKNAMRRVMGKKIKGRGEKKSKATQEFTPLQNSHRISWKIAPKASNTGVYNVEYSPPPVGKKIKSLKKRKKESFEDLTLLAVPKGKM